MATYGRLREDILLIPVSGKALPVYRGEVLRILQEEGAECVDSNWFNLHDYMEHFSASLSRRQGFQIPKGGFGISRSPRDRLMFQVIEKLDTCVIDVLAHRCSSAMLEAGWGIPDHTNCQDTLAEAIGEYGLTPDHTHATLCFWMPTSWDDKGYWGAKRNCGVKKGDYVDVLALMDILAVACTCGSSDWNTLGKYFQRPVRLQVFEASAETTGMVEEVFRRYPPLKTQMKPEDFRVKHKDKDRKLRKIPGYRPVFKRHPLRFEEVETEIRADDYEEIERLIKLGLRDDAEDAVRSGVMEWYRRNLTKQHPLLNRTASGQYD